MLDGWSLLKETVIWILFIVFCRALWKQVNPSPKRGRPSRNPSATGKWYLPDPKSALIIAGWLLIISFPTLFSVAWYSLWIVFLIVICLALIWYVGSRFVSGWSVTLEKDPHPRKKHS